MPARTVGFLAFDSTRKICRDSFGTEHRPHVFCPQFGLLEERLCFGAVTVGM